MPIEQAPNLGTRIQLQQEREKYFRNIGESWNWPLGDYVLWRDDISENHHPIRTITNSHRQQVTLTGYEVFLHDTALNLLKKKRGTVVMLDIGGGAGATWNRLAIAMRDEIEDSRLALVVSNIVASPDQHRKRFETLQEKRPYLTQLHDTEEIKSSGKDAEGLTQFITGSFFSLRMQRITLPNGQTLRLEGNIDFLNEKRSLTQHTITPELDLPIIGFLLSEYGIYAVPNYDVNLEDKVHGRIEERSQAIQIGHGILKEHFGLERVHTIKRESNENEELPITNHHIFKAIQAPEITTT